MTASYSITKDSEFSGATIFIDGEPHTISSTHPAYTTIIGLLLDEVDDDQKLLGLINPAIKAGQSLTALSERISIRGTTIYFDGDPLEAAVADHIARIFNEGADEKAWKPLVNFLEKVSTNPSKLSRQHLYFFVENNNMTIAEDGDLILYKGVKADGTSVHAGYGIVDGKVFGSVDEKGNLVKGEFLQNEVGSVVEIPRSMVDSDRGRTCSTGLHAGSYGYASSFAQRLLTVKVNPRDVVSVPHDYNSSKVRVARYVVLEENAGEYTSTTLSEADDDFEEEETDDYDDEFSVSDFGYEPNLDEGFEDEDDLDLDDEDDDDEIELSDEQIIFNNHVSKFEKLIPGLPLGEIRRFRNKKVTAGQRLAYDEALKNLGL